nr:hypothetical protein [Clostridium sp. Marseille-P7770]
MTTDEIKKSLSCVYGEIQLKGSQEALGKYFGALKECVEILDKYETLKKKNQYQQIAKLIRETRDNPQENSNKNTIIDKFVSKVKLKYLGVHPDELHNPHYAEDIVETIKEIAEDLKEE